MFSILFTLVQVGLCYGEVINPYANPIMAWVYSDVRCQPYYLEHTDRYFCTDEGVFTCVSKYHAFNFIHCHINDNKDNNDNNKFWQYL